jgi:site-specific DNA recombinase
MNAAIYIRVSTDDQAREGHSPEAQERRCREYAKAEGYELAEEHVYAETLSGAKADRPRYQAMLADAAAVAFGAIITWKFDRLGRDAEELLRARRMLEAAGVSLISVTEGEAEGTLIYGVRALVAQEEREKIAERTRMGLAEIARSGRQPCGQPPLGYRVEGERNEARWVVDEEEAQVVRRIFGLYLQGLGINALSQALHEAGITTRRGARFSARATLGVLDNPAYIGLVRFREQTFPGVHEPILDRATWDEAQALRRSRRASENGGRGRPPKGSHLLSGGLLRCGRCGRAMTAKTNTNGWEHYRCSRRHVYGDCDMPSISRVQVDGAILRHFEAAVYDEEGTRATLAESAQRRIEEARSLAEHAERQEGEAEASLARIRADYKTGAISADEWASFRAELEEEQTAAREEAHRLREQAAAVEAQAARIDAETMMIERLTELRQAIAGKIESAEGVAALRITLAVTFSRIILQHDDEGTPFLTPYLWDEAVVGWRDWHDESGQVTGLDWREIARLQAAGLSKEEVAARVGAPAGWEPRARALPRKAALRLDLWSDAIAPSLPDRPCPGDQRWRRTESPAGGGPRPRQAWPPDRRGHV